MSYVHSMSYCSISILEYSSTPVLRVWTILCTCLPYTWIRYWIPRSRLSCNALYAYSILANPWDGGIRSLSRLSSWLTYHISEGGNHICLDMALKEHTYANGKCSYLIINQLKTRIHGLHPQNYLDAKYITSSWVNIRRSDVVSTNLDRICPSYTSALQCSLSAPELTSTCCHRGNSKQLADHQWGSSMHCCLYVILYIYLCLYIGRERDESDKEWEQVRLLLFVPSCRLKTIDSPPSFHSRFLLTAVISHSKG